MNAKPKPIPGFPLRFFLSASLAALVAGCVSDAGPRGFKPVPPPASPLAAAPAEPPPAPRPSPEEILKRAAAEPVTPFEGEGWRPLFDGKTLTGWKVTEFAGHADVACESGLIVLNMGDPFTGIHRPNDPPSGRYEVAFDAMRVMGADFFCGFTFPVRDSFCSLIVGGWGGSLVGISSIDGSDASENETTHMVTFETGRWYRIRVRVTEPKIEVWIGKDKLIDVKTADRRISLRPGDIEMSKPFGIAAWMTTAALREIRIREVPSSETAK
jgi:hypothetical protein